MHNKVFGECYLSVLDQFSPPHNLAFRDLVPISARKDHTVTPYYFPWSLNAEGPIIRSRMN